MGNFVRNALEKAFKLREHSFEHWDELANAINHFWAQWLHIRVCC